MESKKNMEYKNIPILIKLYFFEDKIKYQNIKGFSSNYFFIKKKTMKEYKKYFHYEDISSFLKKKVFNINYEDLENGDNLNEIIDTLKK